MHRFGKNMSRIGNKSIQIPAGAKVTKSGNIISVTGPKGELSFMVPAAVELGDVIKVTGESNLTGLTRTLIANAIKGVTEEWTKTLELSGTGYRVQGSGKQITLSLGFSHQVVVDAPEGVSFDTKENRIVVRGVNRETIGEVAAKIRKLRPADPYKAKGFKYEGEVIVRKAGKAAKAAGAAGGK